MTAFQKIAIARELTATGLVSLDELRNAWRHALTAVLAEMNRDDISHYSYVRLSDWKLDCCANIETITRMIIARNAN